MQNLTLEFEQNNAHAGYRLHNLEVYNWGTFNGKNWVIEPHGSTSLLTGANGSGKSTLVDALLTLLVPNVKRNYNLASGSEHKRERSEKTYMLGAFGNIKHEDGHRSRVQYLRTPADYSVLLARFYNEGYKSYVTLAQVFWMQNEAIRKFFVVSARPLSIREQFSDFSSIIDLKARLRQTGAEVYDQFNEYSGRFRKLFGLRSEKALDLFNQTVTIKVIGDLNDFVRTHMIEKANVDEKIADLRLNYENLTRAHDAIRRARLQLEQLGPIVEEADGYQKILSDVEREEHVRQAVPFFFAGKKKALLLEGRAQKSGQLDHARNELEARQAEHAGFQEKEKSLEIAIGQDEAGRRIREIGQEIRFREERLAGKKRTAAEYDLQIRALGFGPATDDATFDKNRNRAEHMLGETDGEIDQIGLHLITAGVENDKLQGEIRELEQELESLKRRKSQIPEANLRLRARILEALDLTEEDLPFAGELIKVRDDESAWRGAIERLLHHFGLCLLVDEKHYGRLNHYVNQTDLKGRVVYNRIQQDRAYRYSADADPDSLVFKVEVKPDSEFAWWIEQELARQYNYACCEDLERFRREVYALTRNGLIKSGKVKHEKDDRRAINDPRSFILGWSNIDKIAALQSDLAESRRRLDDLAKRVNTLNARKRELDETRDALRNLLRIEHFSDIDWESDARAIQRLREERQTLEQSSDRLRQLKQHLDEVRAALQSASAALDKISRQVLHLERDIEDIDRDVRACDEILALDAAKASEPYAAEVAARVDEASLSADAIDKLQQQVSDGLIRAIEELRQRAHRLEKSIEKRMQIYIAEYPESAAEVDATVSSIPDFRRFHDQIRHEDLPRHEKRFKELLDEKVVTDIAFFRSQLDRQIKEIEMSIANLNRSLRSIDYTPATYIHLNTALVRDVEIRDFKNMLKECTEGTIGASADDNERRFEKVRELIERFDGEPNWAAKVTDVRNWLDFSASERYRDGDEIKNYYSDSSGKSGGQKAKLAYTILASAIAYQFGLDYGETRSKSLRFVVIDEAFSKSDEANSRYAMELFKKLDLQLLVVSPLDKTHVVEPYINACHFVTNNEQENDSKVFNLTMKEYYEKKEFFRWGGGAFNAEHRVHGVAQS